MSLPLIIVALSLAFFVCAQVLQVVQNLIGSLRYPALVKVWELSDKLQLMWFEFKTHMDATYTNADIGDASPLEQQPTAWKDDIKLPYPLYCVNENNQITSFNQPPVRSTHAANPRNGSPRSLLHEQTGHQHGSEESRRHQHQESRRQHHQPRHHPSIFSMRIS